MSFDTFESREGSKESRPSEQDLAKATEHYKSMHFSMLPTAINELVSMAQGKLQELRTEHYPGWQSADFQVVVDALKKEKTMEYYFEDDY